VIFCNFIVFCFVLVGVVVFVVLLFGVGLVLVVMDVMVLNIEII